MWREDGKATTPTDVHRAKGCWAFIFQVHTGFTSGPFRAHPPPSLTWVGVNTIKSRGEEEKKPAFLPLKAMTPYSNKFHLVEAIIVKFLVFSLYRQERAWMGVDHSTGGASS